MTRHYIREAAVVGLYQFFLHLEFFIDDFLTQTNEQSPITRDLLRQHKKEFDISHYAKFLSKDSDDKEHLENFIEHYGEALEEFENRLVHVNTQLKIDIVIFIQLLQKMQELFSLKINADIDAWMSKMEEFEILEYEDFWENKNEKIKQIKDGIVGNTENLGSVEDLVSRIFFGPIFREYMEEMDIEWENNENLVKKEILSEALQKNFVEDEKFNVSNEFYLGLVKATVEHLDEINAKIKEHLLNWDFERLGVLDKAILSLAIGEFFYANHLPKQIIINEYLEISKKISRIDSSSFINGILDKALF